MSLFQFQRTLEEIDQTDTGRLSRALEAGQIDRTWGKPRTEMSSSDWAKYQSTLVWFKREGKKLLDD